MPPIRIPKDSVSGFETLVGLAPETVTALTQALGDVQPTLLVKNLVNQVAASVAEVPRPELEGVLKVIVGLYALKSDTETPTEQFARNICDALALDVRVSKPPTWECEAFAKTLTAILQATDNLTIIGKAADVLTEHEHTACDLRILTDVRPVFGSDSAQAPQSFVIVHTLRIGYHADRQHKEFFVALDTTDLDELLKIVNRAHTKTKALKALLDEKHLQYLDVETQE